MSKNKFYITTPIFYVNAKPHIGHAFTMIASDVIARYHRLKGDETWFLTGTDEHGIKIARAAQSAGKSEQEFADEISQSFRDLTHTLNISNDDFIRTTDRERHWPGVIVLWERLAQQQDLYKGMYEGLYCVGHEAFLKKTDLVDGVCPDHKLAPEVIKEENYFFALKKYKDQLKKLYENGTIKVYPESRSREVLHMLDDAEDVSFSRPRKDLTWGIPVPGDDTQTIYVWCDALTNYLSAVGYGRTDEYQKWWPADAHVIGKDILRFHAIIWPAMLLAAGLEVPRSLNVHGFITVDGEKMSKTVGNVIDPNELVQKYGLDVVRYFVLREIPSNEDGDFSYKNLESRYNSDLANGLGNLTARVLTLAAKETFTGDEEVTEKVNGKIKETKIVVDEKIQQFKLHEALAHIWELLAFGDAYVNETQAWKREDKNIIFSLVTLLDNAAVLLQPFMPETAEKIRAAITREGAMLVVKPIGILFPRLEPRT